MVGGRRHGRWRTDPQHAALADKEASPLPLNELRTFAEVFSLIKQSYVEPVTDKKLIDEAIKAC